MGFFDSLFGGGSKAEAPKQPKKKKAAPVVEAQPVSDNGLTPEVVAAISASVNMILDDASDPVVIAAVTAAIAHSRGGVSAVKIYRPSNAWAASGRQKLMDGRQIF